MDLKWSNCVKRRKCRKERRGWREKMSGSRWRTEEFCVYGHHLILMSTLQYAVKIYVVWLIRKETLWGLSSDFWNVFGNHTFFYCGSSLLCVQLIEMRNSENRLAGWMMRMLRLLAAWENFRLQLSKIKSPKQYCLFQVKVYGIVKCSKFCVQTIVKKAMLLGGSS